jgi:sulfur-carrier protein
MTKVWVSYHAVLRERAGRTDEAVVTGAPTAAALYEELARRHGFSLPSGRVRIAVDGEFAARETPLRDDMRLVFIPPFAGG